MEDEDPTDGVAANAGVTIERRGALSLVSAAEAGAFVDACVRLGVRIIGAEGFRLDGDYILPDMEAILDLSGVTDARESADATRRFLSKVAVAEHWFEFVVTR
jgi:hypothetical protein